MRRPRPLLPCLLAIAAATAAAPTAHAAPPGLGTWNQAEQGAVARANLLPALADGRFHGERPALGTELGPALDAVAQAAGAPRVAVPSGRLSVAAFDGLLVRQLGLGDVAAAVQAQAQAAGLQPPARFGTEVVARQLQLRTNHPAAQDALELFPWDPITRAEAAHSLAVLLDGGASPQAARDVLARFTLPAYTSAQRRVLRSAIQFIGMPYVWGGELDTRSARLGGQVHGGYDCSGFVWRVFKLSGLPAGRAIRGRTAAQIAGEIPRAQRIAFDDVRPADVLFFGPGRFWQKATEARIVHTGIALGNGFMLHSSAQGVYVSPLWEDWRRAEFSWARRLL